MENNYEHSPSPLRKSPSRFEDFRPYETPSSLGNLRGNATGSITLPHSVFWAPGSKTIPLSDDGNIAMAYQAILSEGSEKEQIEYLNRELLIEIWPKLNLPIKVVQLWHSKFPELSGNPKEAWPAC